MQLLAKFDMSDVERGLDSLKARGRALAGAFRELVPAMREDQRDHAKSQAGPDGRWPPRAPSTRKSHGNMPRRPLGKLSTAVSYRAGSMGASAESRIAWSGVHQDGGKVGNKATLPARTFLWISDRFLDFTVDVLGAKLVRAFGGG